MYEKLFDYIDRGVVGIYKITNKINGKIYIGQSLDIRRRWTAHVNVLNETNHTDREKKYALHQALLKYGVENFTFEVIEKCCIDELDEREKYWIKYSNSYLKGCNENEGGSAVRGRPSYVDQVILLLQTTQSTFDEIAQIAGTSAQSVGHINRGESFKTDGVVYPIRKSTKEVIQYTADGIEIATFNCAADAERETGVPAHNIRCVCRNYKNGQITAGGFQWRFIADRGDLISRQPNNRKRVGKFNQEDELLQVFESAAEAARSEGVVRDHVSRVCRGERKSLHGFIWKYLD